MLLIPSNLEQSMAERGVYNGLHGNNDHLPSFLQQFNTVTLVPVNGAIQIPTQCKNIYYAQHYGVYDTEILKMSIPFGILVCCYHQQYHFGKHILQ